MNEDEEKFILYEEETGGWHAGRNEKYSDVFNLTASKNCAKIFKKDDAIKLMENYNKRGYSFIIQRVVK